MSRTADFFTPQQQADINEAVTRAERTTTGEIVTMIVRSSDDYPQIDWLAGGGAALIITLVVDVLWKMQSTWMLLLFFVISSMILSRLVRRLPWVKRRLIHPRELEAAVHHRALVGFMSEGLHKTPENNGVLILISLFERRVEIVADSGIHDRVAPGTWKTMVDYLTDGMKQDQACEALCRTIEETANILAQHFPADADNANHLPNLIIEGATGKH